MNPQTEHAPGLGLPQPSLEVGQASVGHAPNSFRAPEIAAPHFETVPSPTIPAAPSVQQMQSAVPAQQPVAPIAAAPMQPTVDDSVLQGDDNDSALDEEWITKAREIVERTHADPYMQSQEISKIKAQYIKVRYNKDIKVGEEA